MRKTLLIAAATLAAGILSTQAQNVYSQNVVGYVNTAIPGSGALTLICNPLQVINGTRTNDASDALKNLVGGEIVYVWKGNGYYGYIYGGAGSGVTNGFPSDFYDGNPGTAVAIPGSVYDSYNDQWWTPPLILKQGQAVYVQNPGAPLTNTFVGNVVLENTNNPVNLPGSGAMSLVGSTVPVGGNITNLSLPFIGGEIVFVWKGNGYYGYIYGGLGSGVTNGFASDYYDGNPGTAVAIPGSVYDSYNDQWWTPGPSINVGSGFFVQNPGAPLTWKQNFVMP